MPDNPFKPPDSRLKDKPRPPGSPLRAVLTGLVVDIGGSTVLSIMLSVFYAVSLSASGMSSDDVREAMSHIPPTSTVAILGTVLGALCSVAGGYVCARIVQRDEYRVGAVMATLSAVFGLLLGGAGTPDDMVFLLTLCTVACVLLGVKYGRARNRPPSPRDGEGPA